MTRSPTANGTRRECFHGHEAGQDRNRGSDGPDRGFSGSICIATYWVKRTFKMTESIIPFSVLKMLADTARAAPPGNFVEVGVFRGGSAQILYNIARNQDSDSKLREVHLFDTFTGIPFADAIDRHQPGEFNGGSSLEHLRRAMPDAFFHVGIFPRNDASRPVPDRFRPYRLRPVQERARLHRTPVAAHGAERHHVVRRRGCAARRLEGSA